MRRLKLALFLFVIVMLLGLAGLYVLQVLQRNSNSLPLKIESINQKTNRYTIKAEYPLFDTAPKAFNDKITKDVNDRINEFKAQVAENEKVRQDIDYSFTLWWEQKQLNNKYISFILRDESFTGGANENTDLFTYNLNLKTGKEVTLADLLGTDKYLNSLSKYVKNDLTSQFSQLATPDILFEDGIAPKAENFRNFVFDDNTIDFYFPKYQVAPGAYGEQHVILPRSTVIKD